MNEKEKFISDKMRILVGKENYSRPQAYAISLSLYEKEQQKAQQGKMFNQTIPQQNFTISNLNQLPNQGYDFSYNGFNPQPLENNTQFGQNNFSNYTIPEKIDYSFNPQQSFTDYNQTQTGQEPQTQASPYTQNSVNIQNPYSGISLDYALNFAGEGFGSGNYGQAALGTGTALLKGARNFLTGYSTGKENKRVGQEYMDKRYDRTPNYAALQQGGVKNSDIIAQNAITDTPNYNINLENNEFVMRNNGQVQPVIGDKHIENGKKADGVNAKLEDGDKVLSNYVKLKPTDIKDLKERYDISLKRGATFADAQKKLDQKLGIKKLEDEKADILEKIEKATKIKDVSSKQLSLEVLSKKTGDVNEKLNTLSGIRADNFEFLFQRQEMQPKLGSGTELYDKNGKEVTESNEEVAQQGGYSREETYGMNLMKIKGVQGGVTNTKLGDGYYLYHDKLPTDQGFDVNKNREFVTDEAYTNIVQRSPAYQEYMKSLQQPKNTQQLVEMQQGGNFEALAKKYNISPERAQELMSFQQGGIQSEQEENEEGETSNAQEEQGEINPQEIIEDFAEATQQDPQQIIAQLQKMSPEEQQQALGQMIQTLQQNPKEESEENEEEEMEVAQQGGKKEYYQQAGKYSEKDQQARLNDFYNMSTGLGYEGKKEIGAMQNWMADNYPDEVVNYFTTNGQPLTAKHVDIIKNKYKDAFEETGINANKKSEDYTAEEKLKLQTALGDKANKDFLLEGFKDNKWDWRFPMVAQNSNKPIQGTPSPQITAPNMDKFYLPEEPQVAPQVSQETVENPQKEVETSGVKNIMPNFGTYIPLFSPMSPIAKETATFSRAEPIKVTPESILAEQAQKSLNQQYATEQSGMSPQQQAAVLGQGLYANQAASNDAISKVEQFNAQNQFATDQYNLGAKTKEQVMNAQYRQDFQNKAFQTIANTQTDIENKYRSNFLQNVANQNKVINMNTANALNNQFAITDQGVVPLNNKAYELPKMHIPKSVYDKLTAEEVNAIKKKAGATGMQLEIS